MLPKHNSLIFDELPYQDGDYYFLLKTNDYVAFDEENKNKLPINDLLIKLPNNESLTVSCYDEEPQKDVNYVYAQIKGFDEYVTLAVKNNFSVYKMPKFKIVVPDDGFELLPLE